MHHMSDLCNKWRRAFVLAASLTISVTDMRMPSASVSKKMLRFIDLSNLFSFRTQSRPLCVQVLEGQQSTMVSRKEKKKKRKGEARSFSVGGRTGDACRMSGAGLRAAAFPFFLKKTQQVYRKGGQTSRCPSSPDQSTRRPCFAFAFGITHRNCAVP